MKNMSPIQEALFRDLQEKDLFRQAHTFAQQYLDQALERHVYPDKKAVNNLDFFEEDMPDQPVNAVKVLNDLYRYGSPATVAQLGGRYFGFVNGSSVPAGLAAKHLATYWDQNSAMQVMSPVVSKLESVVELWLRQLFGFPDETSAGFVSGTSSANLCGLAAARYRLLKNMGWDIHQKGLYGAPKIRVIAGRHAHSTVYKALGLLGFGKDQIEQAETDDRGRMIPASVPEPDKSTLLVLQAGEVNTGSFDPFGPVCEKAGKAGAWVHIDGAFGLWAAASDELKYLTKGIENADSWAADGHKTLNTPYDCGIVMCRDREAIIEALHMEGSYIIRSKARDGMLYTPEMSRRARIVELWAVLKSLGRQGIDQMISGMHRRAAQFAGELNKTDGFEVLNEIVFNQVLVRCETDVLTEEVIREIQNAGECWVGGSVWDGKKVIRISVCSWATTPDDVRRSVQSFKKALQTAKRR